MKRLRYVFTIPETGWICDTNDTNVAKLFSPDEEDTPVAVIKRLDLLNGPHRYDYEVVYPSDNGVLDKSLIHVYKIDYESDFWAPFTEDMKMVRHIHHTLPFVCALRRMRRNFQREMGGG
jgi:hypothetical protein